MNDVYTCKVEGPIAANTAFQEFFELNSSMVKNKLKSIFWTINLADAVTGLALPLADNKLQRYSLGVFESAGVNDVAGCFENFTIPAYTLGNGGRIQMASPTIYHFNSFFIRDVIQFRLTINNLDVLNPITFAFSCIVEMEAIL